MVSKIKNFLDPFLIIISNIVPIVGVAFFDWNLSTILISYWTENIALGALNLYKIRFLETIPEKRIKIVKGMLSNKGFFILHFGFFTFGHGATIMSLFGKNIDWLFVIPGSVLVFSRYSVSYFVDFIQKQEYKNETILNLFFSPYKRVFAMHATVLFGGIYIQSLGEPMYALLILTFLKTIMDLIAHLRRNEKILGYIDNSKTN